MTLLTSLNSYCCQSKFRRFAALNFSLLLLTLSFLAVSPSANAQAVSVAEIGSGTLAHDRVDYPRWVRVDFEPLITGTHTIRVAWNDNSDLRFNVRQPDGTRLSSTIRGSSPGVWTGELDPDEEYFLGVWAVTGSPTFTATIEAETPATPVTITAQPQDLTVVAEELGSFEVTANGGGPFSYQWLADGSAIPGATNRRLTVRATDDIDGTDYSVRVTNSDGSTVTSSRATLTVVNPLPEITQQPDDITVEAGEDATFVVTARGEGQNRYQWFVNGTAISGATSRILTIESATVAINNTVYTAQVTSGNSAPVTTDGATLTVNAPNGGGTPVTVTTIGEGTLDSDRDAGPRSVRIDFDSLAAALHTITVSWDSNADVRYNVFDDNGTRLSSTVRGSNPGIWQGELDANSSYYLRIWSSTGGVADFNATIEATAPISIERHPANLVVTEGDDATFSVEAEGSGNLRYQWFADGSRLTGQTGRTLTIFATERRENGTEYTVEVSNGSSTSVSDAATLTVNRSVTLSQFSGEADSGTWVLNGPAPTLDFNATANSDAWARVLLRVDDVLLVGGDFTGIQRFRSSAVTSQPFLAALDAVTGEPVSSFRVPSGVNSVVRALQLSPDGSQVYIGGDFGFMAVDARTGARDFEVEVSEDGEPGRVFDIAVSQSQIYIGGDFARVANRSRANIARLSLDGDLDTSWSPNVTHGFETGRAAPVHSITLSPSNDVVYVGGNFGFIDGTQVAQTPHDSNISLLSLNASDGSIRPERFIPDVDNVSKAAQVHDIAVTDDYVIVAWGGPNLLSFHSLAGDRLRQYRGKGDIQALQIVGDHVFVGHHGEFFGFLNNPIPPESVVSINPEIVVPYKLHSFRIDDPSFEPEQAWRVIGPFGVWGIAVSEDSIWISGQISNAGTNERATDGLVRFPALD